MYTQDIFYLFVPDNSRKKYDDSLSWRRQDFNFSFFCHFAWPVSLILTFNAQKKGKGGNAELKIYCVWP